MKFLFSDNGWHGVPVLAAVNISLASLQHFAESLEPIFRAFLPLAQFLVAVATIVYVVRRTVLLKKTKPQNDNEDLS